MAHKELGREMVDRVIKDLKDIAEVEQQAKMEGRQMVTVLAPIRQ
ncbi:MAG: translation initiation factor IF-3 C-terminal domain-containing protein, partial [Gammaproteobacteria bacterium]|nr:translation initiation factor IF-3 C-terminal domain-containing protein [Gammaproteobacteria bacterium]